MTELLRTEDLTKNFGSFTAVDSVSMHIERGAIYGLIGRNGAGKTTILRMLAGFANPTAGSILTEETPGRKLRVSALIEEPGLYYNLSALRNLEIKRLALGIRNENVSSELLGFVGLSQWAEVKTRSFSLGMRQRLGIALALMGEPELLLLDEPTNGLDPEGIAEFRKMMKYLAASRGMTIVISSHQLEELSKIVTHCGILEGGRLLREDSVENIQRSMVASLKIVASPLDKAKETLNNMGIFGYQIQNNTAILLMEAMDRQDEILKNLILNDVHVSSCSPVYDSLEDYFMSVTRGGSHA